MEEPAVGADQRDARAGPGDLHQRAHRLSVPENAARVLRSMPWGGEALPHFANLTNVIDVAFDAAGHAYVLEIGHRLPPFGAATSGQLIRIDAVSGARTTLATGLMFPSGVAIGPGRPRLCAARTSGS